MENDSGTVVVVDDEPMALEMISLLLKSRGFEVRPFGDAACALEELMTRPADLLLTDVYMPDMNGISLMARLRAFDPDTPVIFLTGGADFELAVSAVKMRVFDLIFKPFHPTQLALSVEKGVRQKRELVKERLFKAELERVMIDDSCELVEALRRQNNMSIEIIERLSAAAELRDEETGRHISRIGSYAAIISRALAMPEQFTRMITVAATMHDIGKIGIPDSILFKPASLTPREFEVIKTHSVIGERILAGSRHPMLQMAASIALSHHERWDGSGYPFGLTAEEIPLAGRIVMIADQYDALRSRRSYKASLDHESACAVLLHGDGATRPEHFDPAVLAAFRETATLFEGTFAAERPAQPRFRRREQLLSSAVA